VNLIESFRFWSLVVRQIIAEKVTEAAPLSREHFTQIVPINLLSLQMLILEPVIVAVETGSWYHYSVLFSLLLFSPDRLQGFPSRFHPSFSQERGSILSCYCALQPPPTSTSTSTRPRFFFSRFFDCPSIAKGDTLFLPVPSDLNTRQQTPATVSLLSRFSVTELTIQRDISLNRSPRP